MKPKNETPTSLSPKKRGRPVGSVKKKVAKKKVTAKKQVTSNGKTASYYELPKGATELQHLISHKNMNAQIGEIFRATYRYGECSHSDQEREINKILYYANAELARIKSNGK